MKIESYLPVFPGFYGTIFEPDEDSSIEDDKTYDDYKWEYSEYNERVANACTNFIENELNIGYFWARAILGVFKISVGFQQVSSPGEYNFTNDSINVEYELSDDAYTLILVYLTEYHNEFAEWIKERYTSRSGFFSFHSNDWTDWIEDVTNKEGLPHKFGAVLEFICENEEITVDDMHSDVCGEMYVDCELITVTAV